MVYTEGGLEERYVVIRRDWKPSNTSARYIVLNYGTDHHGKPFDPHATAALQLYADLVDSENPTLAIDLRNALNCPNRGIAQHLHAREMPHGNPKLP